MIYSIYIAGFMSLIVTMLLIPQFMTFFHRKKIGGQQMHEDVKQHAQKAGTPTMGGVVFVAVSLIVSLLFAWILDRMTANFIMVWLVYAGYALVGFWDDFLKVFKQINQGLNAKQKLLAQITTGIIAYLIFQGESGANRLHLLGWQLDLGFLFAVFLVFWLVGFSNAVNLTDGIDGLASISVVISLVAYAVIAVHQKQFDVLVMIMSVCGSLLGFFFFNHKPAKIFMGDVGSLALGGLLAIISIVLRVEWSLLLIGLVYVLETASVILQVTYFKVTQGRRLFRMTPIHHHFELGGWSGKGKTWSEWQVDGLFWLVGVVASCVTLVIYFSI